MRSTAMYFISVEFDIMGHTQKSHLMAILAKD